MHPTEVSVIIPAYNSADSLARAIDSVLTQTFSSFEIIVVNDCSTDGTDAIIADYETKIVAVNLKQNQGVGHARNYGIGVSKGKYLAFLDADDYWEREKLEKQLAFMKAYDYAASCCRVDYFAIVNDKFKRVFSKKPAKDYNPRNYKTLLFENKIITSSVMIRKDVLGQSRFKDIRNRQDLILWVELIKKGVNFGGLDEPLVAYDLSAAGISKNKFKMVLANYRAFRILLGSSPAAAFYTVANAVINLTKRFIGS